ncbi:E3 ubiquitin-protein ligase TRIM33-like [Mercenaria mercenaria]|uniref:E3 ubiquitin-protein ligase TRIM33-like n=1 Tax=Mercenaria mercenaria TaxID=6596 RepID=UPI00234F93C2|nr:E3 ubiquitin-protein ligase TRIM33-like [Mercenaria mercenaria]
MEVSEKKAKQIPSTSILQGSDDDAQFYCIPCEQEGHCVQAHGYCQNCAEYLCETCYRSHRKPAPCRNHVLLDSSKMPKSQKYQRSHPVAHDLVEPCPKHQGEIIKYYCHDHAFFGCSPCITINHRACKADYIPDVSENFVASQEYTNLLHSLKTLCNSCKEIAVTTKENKREIKKRTKDLREKIVKFRQDINHTLDKWEMELNQQVEHIFGKESSKAESVETECIEASTEVQKMQNDIETLHESSKLNELFIKVKKNENNLKKYAALIDQMQEKNTVSDVTFEPNLAIERMLLEETSLGWLILQQDGGSKCLSTTAKEQPYKHHKEPAMERKQQNLAKQAGGQNTNTKKVSDKESVSQKQQTIMTEVKGQKNSGTDVYANITATQSGKIKVKTEKDSKNC